MNYIPYAEKQIRPPIESENKSKKMLHLNVFMESEIILLKSRSKVPQREVSDPMACLKVLRGVLGHLACGFSANAVPRDHSSMLFSRADPAHISGRSQNCFLAEIFVS
jgi:hypothetical protein